MNKEESESDEAPRLPIVDTPNTTLAANDCSVERVNLDSNVPQSFVRISNPFKNLVNGHGHEIVVSDESRTAARILFQQGIQKLSAIS
jgi:hypothetical protein